MSKIPKIIHRTVPPQTTQVMDDCWESAKRHNPDFKFISHVIPGPDESNFPITSPYWDLCVSPAYMADLIRLEALWNFGGIYLDSDVYIYKSMNDLVKISKPFMAKEGGHWICNAVIGSPPRHPAVMELIEETVETIKQGKIAHGPFLATEHWSGRDDVKILEPQTFYDPRFTLNPKIIPDPSRFPQAYGKHLGEKSWQQTVKEKYPNQYKKMRQEWIRAITKK